MSEEQSKPAASGAEVPRSAATGGAGPTRRKTPARSGSTTRRARTQDAPQGSIVAAALASQSRSQNPQGDDSFQSGQRIWPD